MRCLRKVGFWSAVIALMGACGASPASDAAVPGAPDEGDGRQPISTIATPTTLTPSTAAAVTATTQAATPSTTNAVETTAPTTTVVPGTTVPPTTAPAPTTTELVYVDEPAEGTLQFGVKGPRSQQLQADLITLGHLPVGADDGLFGPGTAGGVRRFQEASELVVDGVAGPITLAALASGIEALSADA